MYIVKMFQFRANCIPLYIVHWVFDWLIDWLFNINLYIYGRYTTHVAFGQDQDMVVTFFLPSLNLLLIFKTILYLIYIHLHILLLAYQWRNEALSVTWFWRVGLCSIHFATSSYSFLGSVAARVACFVQTAHKISWKAGVTALVNIICLAFVSHLAIDIDSYPVSHMLCSPETWPVC